MDGGWGTTVQGNREEGRGKGDKRTPITADCWAEMGRNEPDTALATATAVRLLSVIVGQPLQKMREQILHQNRQGDFVLMARGIEETQDYSIIQAPCLGQKRSPKRNVPLRHASSS